MIFLDYSLGFVALLGHLEVTKGIKLPTMVRERERDRGESQRVEFMVSTATQLTTTH